MGKKHLGMIFIKNTQTGEQVEIQGEMRNWISPVVIELTGKGKVREWWAEEPITGSELYESYLDHFSDPALLENRDWILHCDGIERIIDFSCDGQNDGTRVFTMNTFSNADPAFDDKHPEKYVGDDFFSRFFIYVLNE